MIKPTLAKSWDESHNPKGWLLSEKLDGIRAIWTGSELITRNQNTIHAPAWFINQLPQGTALDGELWIDRGQFQLTSSIVRKLEPVDSEWEQIKFMVFDCPSITGPHSQRMIEVEKHCTARGPIQAVKHTACRSRRHLETFTQKIIDQRGEGTMLRQPNALYTQSRTGDLRKHKMFIDSDAVVTGYAPGKGKHEGVVGALLVHSATDNKIKFRVGTGLSDAQRREPPAIGSTIIVEHDGYTNAGKPRFPTFLGQRAD